MPLDGHACNAYVPSLPVYNPLRPNSICLDFFLVRMVVRYLLSGMDGIYAVARTVRLHRVRLFYRNRSFVY